MKIEIKSRFTGDVLFAHEAENNTIMLTVEAAVSVRTDLTGSYLMGADLAGAKLNGADLRSSDLRSADLVGADLNGANLRGAYLVGADLSDADLSGADIMDANLSGANFSGAKLNGAKLRGAKLIGDRPILQLGPLGSRCDYLIAFLTDAGIKIRAECFFGSLMKFVDAVKSTHGDNQHGREYMAAVSMIQAHAEIWTPKEEVK